MNALTLPRTSIRLALYNLSVPSAPSHARPVIARSMTVRSAAEPDGTYDARKQITIDRAGRPLVHWTAATSTKTFTGKDPAEPISVAHWTPAASVGTSTRADKDPVDSPEPLVHASTGTLSKADKDPADPPDPAVLASLGTSTKADKDPAESPEPLAHASTRTDTRPREDSAAARRNEVLVVITTLTETSKDPADPVYPIADTPRSGYQPSDWSDTPLTGRVAF